MKTDTLKYYTEANRYLDNANDVLKKAGKNGKYYLDSKYVSSACGIAYKGVLVALTGFIQSRGIAPPKRKASIEYFQESISKIDRKMLNSLNTTYHVLHLEGYYEGFTDIKVIERGFEEAVFLINSIRPK